ncbi:GNAT family N-acetyltransferase [Sediminimonas qiaohouensis]|uniref:GNAT family N-acetyltransferase n=1 Tax=Sediminimonas qiaohouensis TaxID=552061 RepID=UPI00042A6909|nr:N-acetyltransferase [Sediminimonas qiaohouensis]
MRSMPGFMREMRRGEERQVDALLRRAFGGQDEARLVARLRKAGAIAGEMVIPTGGQVMAYAALSAMRAPKGWLCLAPVAVDPEAQGQRLGTRLVGMIAEWARLSGVHVVVLGDVEFYQRAGFSAARAARLSTPYPVAHTLLAGPGDDTPQETLIYPAAFEDP